METGEGDKDMRNLWWENKEARSSSCQTDENFQTGGEVISYEWQNAAEVWHFGTGGGRGRDGSREGRGGEGAVIHLLYKTYTMLLTSRT